MSENERRLADRLDTRDLLLRALSAVTLILVAFLALTALWQPIQEENVRPASVRCGPFCCPPVDIVALRAKVWAAWRSPTGPV